MTSHKKSAESPQPSFAMGVRPELLILGASARAAAWSALRSGFHPVCADLFADADLTDRVEAVAVDDFPAGLKTYADRVPPTCWMYTGALENDPRLIAEISRRHHLLGNPADVLTGIRDPFRVVESLQSRGLPFLEVRRSSDTPATDGTWLRKPLHSAGGRQIIVWDAAARSAALAQSPYFFQRYGVGASFSATFLAEKHQSRLLGVTRQLIGMTRWHATPFGYCGSIGPVRLRQKSLKQLLDIGETLVRSFRLRGLMGIDFLLQDDIVRLTEVNPRYTASMEILEMAGVTKLIRSHVDACREFGQDAPLPNVGENERLPERCEKRGTIGSNPRLSGKMRFVGKAILFAEDRFFAPDLSPSADVHLSEGVKFCSRADLPPVGRKIDRGDPICTVFGTGESEAACMSKLNSRAIDIFGTVIQARPS